MSRSVVAYWQDERHQSEADHRGISLAAYIHAIHGFLLQARSKRVLMIGCGGGTLATMLRADGIKATIVEINARSFEISRRYFHLPRDVKCRVGDGRAFLRATKQKYDAIVLDAYDGNHIPKQFVNPAFFRLVRSRLNPKRGCFFVNVVMRNDKDAYLDRIARVMSKAWPNVRLLDAPKIVDRNAIAMAGVVDRLTLPHLVMKPQSGSRLLRRELRAYRFRV